MTVVVEVLAVDDVLRGEKIAVDPRLGRDTDTWEKTG